MKVIRFIPWWLLGVALVVTVLWNYRLETALFGLNLALDRSPLENARVDVSAIDFERINLATLSFDYVDGSNRYHIDGANLEIGYSFNNLKRGSVDNVKIDRLVINRSGNESAPAKSVELPLLLEALEAVLAVEFPVRFLHVEQLVLANGIFSALANKPFALSISAEGQTAQAKIVIRNQRLVIEKTGDRIVTTLIDQRTSSPQPVLTIDANIARNRVEALIDANLSAMRTSLLDLDPGWTWLDPFTGQITLQPTLELQNELAVIELSGQFNNLGISEYQIEHGTASLNLKLDLIGRQLAMAIKPGSTLSLESIWSPSLIANGIELDLAGSIWHNNDETGISMASPSTLSIESLNLSRNHAKIMEVKLDNTWVYTASGGKIEFGKLFIATARSLKLGDVKINGANILSGKVNVLHYDNAHTGNNFRWTHQNGQWRSQPFELVSGKTRVASEDLTINVETASTAGARMKFTSAELRMIDGGALENSLQLIMEASSGQLELKQVGNKDILIEAKGEFLVSGMSTTFRFQANHSLENSGGGFKIFSETPVELAALPDPLITPVFSLIPELIFTTGEIDLVTRGSWFETKAFELESDITLSNTAGSYEEFNFSGLNVDGSFNLIPDITSRNSAHIKVDTLEYGITIHNIESDVELIVSKSGDTPASSGGTPAIEVSTLKGEILGSRFDTEKFMYDSNLDNNHINFHIVGLDIGQVMDAQQFEGLEVSGKVDGILPVDISPDGVSIPSGRFWNQPEGGTIRYSIDPAQTESFSNVLTDVVIEALKDFRFNRLTADVAYNPDGKLNVLFHIEGSSPNLNTSRPVHLNINSEQNVLSLLDSLKYTEGLNNKLDQRLKDQYKKSADNTESN